MKIAAMQSNSYAHTVAMPNEVVITINSIEAPEVDTAIMIVANLRHNALRLGLSEDQILVLTEQNKKEEMEAMSELLAPLQRAMFECYADEPTDAQLDDLLSSRLGQSFLEANTAKR